MPAPPGIVMVAPPEVLRNAQRAQCEGPRQGGVSTKRGQGQYKGRSPKAPTPVVSILVNPASACEVGADGGALAGGSCMAYRG